MTALTPPELEVLIGAAHDERAADTARRVGRSLETVKTHRKNVIAKLGVRSMTGAVAVGYEQGLLGAKPKREQRPLSAGKRDAFHAKCDDVDQLRGLERRSTKKLMLAQASLEFGREITSANDLTDGEAAMLLDLLDLILDGSPAKLGAGEKLLAVGAAS